MDDKEKVHVSIKDVKIDKDFSMKFEFDPLEHLHNHVNEMVSNVAKRVLNRYCGVCFFGIVHNTTFGIPVCGKCINALFPKGIEKATKKEVTLFRNMAIRGRDAREALYMQLMRPVDENGGK